MPSRCGLLAFTTVLTLAAYSVSGSGRNQQPFEQVVQVGVSRQSYREVRIGMTQMQVAHVLGAPYKGVLPLNFVDVEVDEVWERMITSSYMQWWLRGGQMIGVAFDRNDRVVGKWYSRDPNR